jgi:hypothetical protein
MKLISRRSGGGGPPKLRAPELLRRLLAWCIQTDAFGGLDAVTRRLIKTQASELRDRLARRDRDGRWGSLGVGSEALPHPSFGSWAC